MHRFCTRDFPGTRKKISVSEDCEFVTFADKAPLYVISAQNSEIFSSTYQNPIVLVIAHHMMSVCTFAYCFSTIFMIFTRCTALISKASKGASYYHKPSYSIAS